MTSRARTFIMCLLCAGFLALTAVTQPRAIRARADAGLEMNTITEGVPASIAIATTALGGFRGLLVDLLWMRCQSMKQDGKFYEMAQLYDWITNLEPHYPHVWAFAGWDMAYNVSVDVEPQERWFWVRRGIHLIQDKGMRLNRNDPDIPFELAWIYFHKIGNMLDYGHVYYRTALAFEMEQLFGGPCDRRQLEILAAMPEREEDMCRDEGVLRLQDAIGESGLDPVKDYNALRHAPELKNKPWQAAFNAPEHAPTLERIFNFHVARRLRDEYNMDPARMLALNTAYGPIDWRSCDAWSLYWAVVARDNALRRWGENKLIMKYERLVYFSLGNMVERGAIRFSSDGFVYEVPDYHFLPGWIDYMTAVIDGAKVKKTEKGETPNVIGIESALQYGLRDAIVNYYFNGLLDQANTYMKILTTRYPDPKNQIPTVEGFVMREMQDFIDSVSKERLLGVIEGLLRNSYIRLALGDVDQHKAMQVNAETMHKYGKKRYPVEVADPNETANMGYIPPLRDMSADVLMRLVDGDDPSLTPAARERLKAAVPESVMREAEVIYKNKKRIADSLRKETRPDGGGDGGSAGAPAGQP